MSIADRIRELSTVSTVPLTEACQEASPCTTLAVADPVARRISGLLRELGVLFGSMTEKDWLTRQMHIILDAVREEIEENPGLFAGPAARVWIIQFAELMRWTATGDYQALPADLVRIAQSIDGIPAQSIDDIPELVDG
jgi:hypothetical protein